jgi:hypothetical protein
MPGFNDGKITFIHIPRTGGSSISRWLSPIFEDKYIVRDHIFLNEIENPAPITFTVIRNPWDRVVSMYSFIKIYMHCLVVADFNDFVLNKIKIWTFGKHKLSTPQIRWIETGVTHLLRFEDLEEDFKIIQDIFQCYKPLPLINKSKHEHYRAYYNDETRQIIAEMFKEDIEAFGYEF